MHAEDHSSDGPPMQPVLLNVLGQPAQGPFYIWANEDCANMSESWIDAKRIRRDLVADGAVSVYIVDVEGVEVVDAEVEEDERREHNQPGDQHGS